MKKLEVKLPRRLRILNIVIGILYIIISIYIILNISLAVRTLFIFLGINMILMGILKLVIGINFKEISKDWLIINILLAVFYFSIGIIVFINPNWGVYWIALLIAISLLTQGIYRMIYAVLNKNISVWATAINILIGLMSIVATIYTLLNPDIVIGTLIILLSVLFILYGINRILSGLKGYIEYEEEDN